MSNLANQLQRKGQTEEDLYFARQDRERIEALRQQRLAESLECPLDVTPSEEQPDKSSKQAALPSHKPTFQYPNLIANFLHLRKWLTRWLSKG